MAKKRSFLERLTGSGKFEDNEDENNESSSNKINCFSVRLYCAELYGLFLSNCASYLSLSYLLILPFYNLY